MHNSISNHRGIPIFAHGRDEEFGDPRLQLCEGLGIRNALSQSLFLNALPRPASSGFGSSAYPISDRQIESIIGNIARATSTLLPGPCSPPFHNLDLLKKTLRHLFVQIQTESFAGSRYEIEMIQVPPRGTGGSPEDSASIPFSEKKLTDNCILSFNVRVSSIPSAESYWLLSDRFGSCRNDTLYLARKSSSPPNDVYQHLWDRLCARLEDKVLLVDSLPPLCLSRAPSASIRESECVSIHQHARALGITASSNDTIELLPISPHQRTREQFIETFIDQLISTPAGVPFEIERELLNAALSTTEDSTLVLINNLRPLSAQLAPLQAAVEKVEMVRFVLPLIVDPTASLPSESSLGYLTSEVFVDEIRFELHSTALQLLAIHTSTHPFSEVKVTRSSTNTCALAPIQSHELPYALIKQLESNVIPMISPLLKQCENTTIQQFVFESCQTVENKISF